MAEKGETATFEDVKSGGQCERLVRLAAQALRAGNAYLCVYEEDVIRVVHSVGDVLGPEVFLGYPCRFDAGDPHPLAIADLETDQRVVGPRQATLPGGVGRLAATPLYDRKHQPFGFVCVTGAEPRGFSADDLRLLDIFAVAISEEVLRAGASPLALDSQSDPQPSSWITNHGLDGGLTEASDDFEKLTGFTPGEVKRLKLEDLVAAEDRERIRQLVLEQFGGGSSRRRSVGFRNKDGSVRDIELECRVRFAAGNVVGFQTTGRPKGRREAEDTDVRAEFPAGGAVQVLDLLLNQRPIEEVLGRIIDAALLRYPDSSGFVLVQTSETGDLRHRRRISRGFAAADSGEIDGNPTGIAAPLARGRCAPRLARSRRGSSRWTAPPAGCGKPAGSFVRRCRSVAAKTGVRC